MKGKLLFVAGAAVGYILGARAGRKRYEQIKAGAQKVWETPQVQKQVSNVQEFVYARVGEVPSALADGVKKLANSLANNQKDHAQPAETGAPSSRRDDPGSPETPNSSGQTQADGSTTK